MFCRGIYDKNTEIKLPNHHLSFDLARRTSSEPLLRQIVTVLISNSAISGNILDAGCWIGDNAVFWAANHKEICYAIDPADINLTFIHQVAQLNSLSNLVLLKCALSSKNEILTTQDNLFHASFVYESQVKGEVKQVQAVSLDYLFSQGLIKNLGFIHLDVEGMELKVLEGASNLISLCRPIIAFEQHLDIDPVSECIKFLKDRGYFVFMIDEILEGCRPDCRNFLAFPGNVPEKIYREIQSIKDTALILF